MNNPLNVIEKAQKQFWKDVVLYKERGIPTNELLKTYTQTLLSSLIEEIERRKQECPFLPTEVKQRTGYFRATDDITTYLQELREQVK